MVVGLIFLLVVIFIGGIYFLLKVSDVVRDFNDGHDAVVKRVEDLEAQVVELNNVVVAYTGKGSGKVAEAESK